MSALSDSEGERGVGFVFVGLGLIETAVTMVK